MSDAASTRIRATPLPVRAPELVAKAAAAHSPLVRYPADHNREGRILAAHNRLALDPGDLAEKVVVDS